MEYFKDSGFTGETRNPYNKESGFGGGGVSNDHGGGGGGGYSGGGVFDYQSSDSIAQDRGHGTKYTRAIGGGGGGSRFILQILLIKKILLHLVIMMRMEVTLRYGDHIN